MPGVCSTINEAAGEELLPVLRADLDAYPGSSQDAAGENGPLAADAVHDHSGDENPEGVAPGRDTGPCGLDLVDMSTM